MIDSERETRFPLGGETRLADLAIDPYPLLARLRELEPVSWVSEVGMWFVTRRADVLAVLNAPMAFVKESESAPVRDTFGPQMLSSEGAEQRRFRGPCNPLFRTATLETSMAPFIEAEANRLIDGFAGAGTVELRRSFANPLAVHSVMSIVGLRLENAPRIREWYDEFAVALANFTRDPVVRERGQAAASAFAECVAPIIRTNAGNDDGSLFAALVNAGSLTEAEVISNALVALFGGIETTESMISNAVWALLKHPDQFRDVLDDRSLLGNAIEESLRWEPAVQSCTRHALHDIEIGGVTIRTGDTVQCMVGAANRDPAYFTNPDTFDIRRTNAADHVAFGHGRHLCLGAALARLETRISLDALFDRLPDLRLDAARTIPPRGYEFRKPPELWAAWAL